LLWGFGFDDTEDLDHERHELVEILGEVLFDEINGSVEDVHVGVEHVHTKLILIVGGNEGVQVADEGLEQVIGVDVDDFT
jgi:hypothetical protein